MTNRCACVIAFGLVLAASCSAAQTTVFSNVLPAGATVSYQGVDGGGNFYVAGTYIADAADYPDLYVAKISSDGTSLAYLTDLGASVNYPIFMRISGMAVEPDGTVCVLSTLNNQIGGQTNIVTVNPSGGINTQQTTFAGFFIFYEASAVASDSSGNLYFSGFFSGYRR